MPLEVTVDHPAYDDGVPIEITGLGLFPNREATEVSPESELNFVLSRRETVRDALQGSDMFEVSGTTTVTGGVNAALGLDSDDVLEISDTIEPPEEAGYDKSPATSMGETWEQRQEDLYVEAEESADTASVTGVSTPPPLRPVLEGGDE